MKVRRSRWEVLLIGAAVIALSAGCGKQEQPVASASAAPQVAAPVSDPQTKQFLETLEKTPFAERDAVIRSNGPLVTKIMNGNDAQAKVQFKKIIGH